MQSAVEVGLRWAHLSYGNQAHAYAAMEKDQNDLAWAKIAKWATVKA